MLAVLPMLAIADDIKTVTVDYLYQIPENISLDEAKSIALDRAKIQAIADEYGTTVTQSNNTDIVIDNGVTTSVFESVGGSELKGEWIETIGEPKYKIITENGMIAVQVSLKGKIREVKNKKIPVKVRTFRNGTDDCNESSKFMAEDAFYMSFNAPANGYLAVYLIDANNQAFCLLPYQRQNEGFFSTKANKNYFLFHKDYAGDLDKDIVDELIMDTDRDSERNRILTIFSPNKFYKAVDAKFDEQLPRNLSYAEFTKWLSGIKKKDMDLSVNENPITIYRKGKQ